MEEWRYTFASTAGQYHRKLGIPCQDSCDCRIICSPDEEPVLIAAVSDGAGSAKYSTIGSRLACFLIMEEMREFVKGGGGALSRVDCEKMTMRLRAEVSRYAEVMDGEARDYACTLVCGMLGEKWAVFFQVGDGAAVISMREKPEQYFPVFWPQKGEYENTTCFVTDSQSQECMNYMILEGTVDKVSLFTDGIERLALDYQNRTAYSPFFTPLFAAVRLDCGEYPAHLADSLARFLSSDRVDRKTDDDRTLIIGVRCDE